jgi:ATP-dependent 26S proteasome regulatory subunit
MGKPRLVFLYGPPAVGKLTVAKAIADRRPFTILHNHLTAAGAADEIIRNL